MPDLPKELNFDDEDTLYQDLLEAVNQGEVSIEEGQVKELSYELQLSDFGLTII